MDRQTELAINELWKRGIDAIHDRIDKLQGEVNARFDKLENERRWRRTQSVFIGATLVTVIADIISRHV